VSSCAAGTGFSVALVPGHGVYSWASADNGRLGIDGEFGDYFKGNMHGRKQTVFHPKRLPQLRPSALQGVHIVRVYADSRCDLEES